jgi:hypothetical protein
MCRQVWSQQLQQEKMMPTFLSAAWHGEALHGLGVQDVDSFILVDPLFPIGEGRRRKGGKKEKEKGREKFLWGRRVSLGLDPPC